MLKAKLKILVTHSCKKEVGSVSGAKIWHYVYIFSTVFGSFLERNQPTEDVCLIWAWYMCSTDETVVFQQHHKLGKKKNPPGGRWWLLVPVVELFWFNGTDFKFWGFKCKIVNSLACIIHRFQSPAHTMFLTMSCHLCPIEHKTHVVYEFSNRFMLWWACRRSI